MERERRRRQRARAHLQRQRRRKRSNTRGRLVAASLFGLGLGAGALVGSPLIDAAAHWWNPTPLPLTAIAVQGHSRLDSRDVAAATGVPKGIDYDQLDLREVERGLVAHPWIRSARALRLPLGRIGSADRGSRILVRIEEREPLALWRREGSDQAHWVDASGTLFAPADTSEASALPVLTGRRSFSVGEPHSQIARAVALAQRAPRPGIDGPVALQLPLAGDASEGWVLRPAGLEAEVILGSEELERRLDRLARLTLAQPDLASGARRIDLRFADRMVLQGGTASRGGGNKRR